MVPYLLLFGKGDDGKIAVREQLVNLENFALALLDIKLLDSLSARLLDCRFQFLKTMKLFNKPLFCGKTFIPKELSDPKRILITHFGNTAEAVQNVPLFVTLRHRFPYAEIAWLIGENAAPLILDHWAINRFVVVRNDWCKHLSEINRIRKRLQLFAPHVAIDPQCSFSSSLAAWLSGAKYRIGFGAKKHRYLHTIRVVAEDSHQIERNLRLLQPFGICGSDVGFDMPECEKDRHIAQNILHRKGLYGNFAMLYISADNSSPRWQEEQYGAVAKYLLEQWNLPSLIVWSGDESELRRAETVVHAAGGAAVQAPWTTLVERKSLSKLATIFVSSETTELQIAAAVGTKCVGLFGSASALENIPFGSEHRVVHAQQENVGRKRKRADVSTWISTVTPKLVCEKCDEVLEAIAELRQETVRMQQVLPVQQKAA